jgi:hypothetical protein
MILMADVDTNPARRHIGDSLLTAYDGTSRALRVHPVLITKYRGIAEENEPTAHNKHATVALMIPVESR